MTPLIPLADFKDKKIVLLTHIGADVDAIASAAALARCLSKKNSVKIAVPEHISLNAKKLAKKTGITYSINLPLREANCLILLDLNSWDMLGKMKKAVETFSGEKYLLDHHSKTGDKIVPCKNAWIEEDEVATCALVYKWIKKSNIALDANTAMLLAAGITTDSCNFLVADANVFSIFAELLRKSGKRFSEIVGLLRTQREFSEKIAMLKAARRSRIFKLGKFIVVTTKVGAFEADSAAALIRIGADLAFVGGLDKKELRISGRANQGILAETEIDLAKDVFQKLGNFFDGNGGGHRGAAAFNGKADNLEKPLLKCVDLVKSALSQPNSKISLKEYT